MRRPTQLSSCTSTQQKHFRDSQKAHLICRHLSARLGLLLIISTPGETSTYAMATPSWQSALSSGDLNSLHCSTVPRAKRLVLDAIQKRSTHLLYDAFKTWFHINYPRKNADQQCDTATQVLNRDDRSAPNRLWLFMWYQLMSDTDSVQSCAHTCELKTCDTQVHILNISMRGVFPSLVEQVKQKQQAWGSCTALSDQLQQLCYFICVSGDKPTSKTHRVEAASQ